MEVLEIEFVLRFFEFLQIPGFVTCGRDQVTHLTGKTG